MVFRRGLGNIPKYDGIMRQQKSEKNEALRQAAIHNLGTSPLSEKPVIRWDTL